jgi:hypothetical protein
MGYDHSMLLDAKVAPGTSIEEVKVALMPIIVRLGLDPDSVFQRQDFADEEFYFDEETGTLHVSTYGEVGYDYNETVQEVATRLGRIVAEPGEIWLIDHDTPDPDEAKQAFEFGPSEEAIKAYIAKRDIEAGLKMISQHVSAATLEALRNLLEVSHGQQN